MCKLLRFHSFLFDAISTKLNTHQLNRQSTVSLTDVRPSTDVVLLPCRFKNAALIQISCYSRTKKQALLKSRNYSPHNSARKRNPTKGILFGEAETGTTFEVRPYQSRAEFVERNCLPNLIHNLDC